MWQYQNTDELYHANMYKNINKKSEYELYHSDIYLGKDFSDGIKHFKYIRKIKTANGWRYIYRDEKGEALDKQYKNAVNQMNSKNANNVINGTVDSYKYGLKRTKHKVLSAPRKIIEKSIMNIYNKTSSLPRKIKDGKKIYDFIEKIKKQQKNKHKK